MYDMCLSVQSKAESFDNDIFKFIFKMIYVRDTILSTEPS